MLSIRQRQPADDATTVREALEYALVHAAPGNRWAYPNYQTGLAGYDTWIDTVTRNRASLFGMSYNAAVWAECRDMGLKFLEEVKQRMNGQLAPLLDEAIENYTPVAENPKALVDMFPLTNDMAIIDGGRRDKSLEHLKRAREAEEKGLESLKEIVAALK